MGDCTEQVNTKGCSKPLLAMDLRQRNFFISIALQEFDHDLGMVLSLSSISRGHLCVSPSFLIPFPNSSAAFVTSSELSDLIWYSSDLMECTFLTSSTIPRLSAQRRRASCDYIFAFYGDVIFIGWFVDLTDTMGEHRWVIMMQCLSLATLVDLTGDRFGCM